jgi:hypothetical protein
MFAWSMQMQAPRDVIAVAEPKVFVPHALIRAREHGSSETEMEH